ncbi:MAG: ATP-binding protein [Deltaproteobacteria bacterium]|nr:ATP-binding protein [Deltaproteobacteria bacterium]
MWQQYVKRWLEISVAGGHNIIMIGPPKSDLEEND